MAPATAARQQIFDDEYLAKLATLCAGSVRVRFDPFLSIDWDSPEFALDPDDRRWVLDPRIDPLGASPWYQALPLQSRIDIGRWRQTNVVKVGLAFETILIRGMMHYLVKLPNGAPEFRYCLHEMTEECNHIQMFQQLVNRIGDDVPGMRPWFRGLSPYIGLLGGYAPAALFIGILAGEEPIDHYQKALLRRDVDVPPAVERVMQIHVAEEARHISFAGEFLHAHVDRMGTFQRTICAIVFPLVMRWLAGEIMTPPRSVMAEFDIPRDVYRQAFWRSPQSRRILAGYFGDMRKLADDLGLRKRWVRPLWKVLHIDGVSSRFRGEPDRTVMPMPA